MLVVLAVDIDPNYVTLSSRTALAELVSRFREDTYKEKK